MCWESGIVSQRQTMLARPLILPAALARISFLPSFIHLADIMSDALACYLLVVVTVLLREGLAL